MSGLAVNWEGQINQSCICDECLGLQLTVLAGLDRSLFEALVTAARENAVSPPQS
jgi:hypothetical protein